MIEPMGPSSQPDDPRIQICKLKEIVWSLRTLTRPAGFTGGGPTFGTIDGRAEVGEGVVGWFRILPAVTGKYRVSAWVRARGRGDTETGTRR